MRKNPYMHDPLATISIYPLVNSRTAVVVSFVAADRRPFFYSAVIDSKLALGAGDAKRLLDAVRRELESWLPW